MRPPRCWNTRPFRRTSRLPGIPPPPPSGSGEIFGVEFGLWEMNAGIMTDVEAEELFVVLSGTATVQVHAANGFDAAVLKLEPGSVCRLSEGMRTTWILDEPPRKLYLTQAKPTTTLQTNRQVKHGKGRGKTPRPSPFPCGFPRPLYAVDRPPTLVASSPGEARRRGRTSSPERPENGGNHG